MYFNKTTEQKIIEYVQLPTDHPDRDLIYKQNIYPALCKLVENIIHNRNLFNYGLESYQNTLRDCVAFLTLQLHKFDAGRNKKAFSYFNRTAINFLVGNKKKIEAKRTVAVDTGIILAIDGIGHNEYILEENRANRHDFFKLWSGWALTNVEQLFATPREQKIAEAILNIFTNVGNIEILEKKAIYIIIKEQVQVQSPAIKKIIVKLKKLYKEMFVEYERNGTRKWKYYTDVL